MSPTTDGSQTGGKGDVQGEATRQAIASLGGYAHQLLASAIAWVGLPPEGELHLEVAEDYAVALGDQLGAVQIKREAGSVTLATEGVRTAIGSLVSLARLNPGRSVRLVFSTTAAVGRERSEAHRTGDVPGLHHWQAVAEGADASRLREVLLALGLGEEVHAFIRKRDDEALRRDLVQRIEWLCGEAETEALWEDLRTNVARLCFRLSELPVRKGRQHADAVLMRVLATCIRSNRRVLSRTDLEDLLREASTVFLHWPEFTGLLRGRSEPAGWDWNQPDPHQAGPEGRLNDFFGSSGEMPSGEPQAFGTAEAKRVRRILGAGSAILLRWPTTTGGRWLERPELATALSHLSQPEAAPLVLLGPPGSGKSALMAKLGAALAERGNTLLAIKADAIPRDVADVASLGRALEVPGALDECLVRLSLAGPMVLLIDQLDALADLMDQHGGRLGALLSLVARVRGQNGLSVILSSREFEFRHDARLSSLEAVPLHLSLPPWEAVRSLLETRGLRPAGWPGELQETLRTPQHLDLFLDHLARDGERPLPRRYHDMLEEVIQQRVMATSTGTEDAEALHAVARAIVEKEEIWVASARFDARAGAIRRLEAYGLLARNGRRIGFRHQTLFDFVRARAFVAGEESIAVYALDHQATVFARPTVWSALGYLRASDPGLYARELDRLWFATDLRPHMRWLVRDFMGRQEHPTDQEARLLLPLLSGEEAARTLRPMLGSAGWFDRLLPRLPGLMAASDLLGWVCADFLGSAVEARKEVVLRLVSTHWLEEPLRCWSVLDRVTRWTGAALDLAERVAGSLDNWRVMRLAEAIGGSAPRCVPGLLLRRLEAILDAEEAGSPGVLARCLDGHEGFHGLGKALARTAEHSVRTLWPWFSAVAAREAYKEYLRGRYLPDNGRLIDRQGMRMHTEDHPGRAFCDTIAVWAREAPDAFLAFAKDEGGSDLEAIHLFLARGFEVLAPQHPEAVLDYLIEDGRRLWLGDMGDPRKVTKALIATVSPALPMAGLSRLVAGIMRSVDLHDLAPYEAGKRLRIVKALREERLDLLMSIPEVCRTEEIARHVREEVRALGVPMLGPRITRLHEAVSRMTPTAMAKAKDRDILRFIGAGGDSDGRIGRRMAGRDRGVDHALRTFAGEQPGRAIRLVRDMEPKDHEALVTQVVAALPDKAEMPPDQVVGLIVDLEDRGFTSREFHGAAAWTLSRAGRHLGGLDDRLCATLAGWLADPLPPRVGRVRKEEPGRGKDQTFRPLLAVGDIRVVPSGGSYPVLQAVEVGFLHRIPPAADAWLDVLREHLARDEDPEVWAAYADDLRFLFHAERGRAVAFLEALFDRHPSLAQREEGLRLLAHVHWWLPEGLIHRRVLAWMDGPWDQGRQAAGELAGLRLVVAPADAIICGLVEREVAEAAASGSTSAFLHGVAASVAGPWRDAAHRETAVTWIERFAAICDQAMAAALRPMFQIAHGRPQDAATERVLRACVGRPALLRADMHFLPRLLKEGLREGLNPILIAEVALDMVQDGDAVDWVIGTPWQVSASVLFEVATTLQRIGSARQLGVELFEAILAAEVNGVGEELARFDRNRFA